MKKNWNRCPNEVTPLHIQIKLLVEWYLCFRMVSATSRSGNANLRKHSLTLSHILHKIAACRPKLMDMFWVYSITSNGSFVIIHSIPFLFQFVLIVSTMSSPQEPNICSSILHFHYVTLWTVFSVLCNTNSDQRSSSIDKKIFSYLNVVQSNVSERVTDWVSWNLIE